MRAVALERTTKRQANVGDLYAKHNGRASGPLWSAKIGRGNHDHGPGPKTLSEPTCLARPWAAAWELYVAHATNQSYAAHLVPRPCAEKLSGDCLAAACAD